MPDGYDPLGWLATKFSVNTTKYSALDSDLFRLCSPAQWHRAYHRERRQTVFGASGAMDRLVSIPVRGLLVHHLACARYGGLDSRIRLPFANARGAIDLASFFDHHRRKFMGAIATLAIVNETTNLTLQGFNTSLLGLMVAAWVVLAVTAYIWAAPRVQYAVAAANVMLTVWYAIVFVPAL